MVHTLIFRVFVKSQKIIGILDGFRQGKVYLQGIKNPFLMKDCYIMQYVGKEDIYGNNIYQHDVIRTEDDETVVVMWSPTSCAFEGMGRENGNNFIITGLEFDKVEVLGNIHLDPNFYSLYQDILLS